MIHPKPLRHGSFSEGSRFYTRSNASLVSDLMVNPVRRERVLDEGVAQILEVLTPRAWVRPHKSCAFERIDYAWGCSIFSAPFGVAFVVIHPGYGVYLCRERVQRRATEIPPTCSWPPFLGFPYVQVHLKPISLHLMSRKRPRVLHSRESSS